MKRLLRSIRMALCRIAFLPVALLGMAFLSLMLRGMPMPEWKRRAMIRTRQKNQPIA